MALLRSFALIAAAAFLLTACSRSPVVQLYEGAKQPDSQVLTIRVPSDLEVFTINGSEVDGVNTFFNTDHKDLKVTPGRYEILAYYKRLWDLDADSHEVMKSDPALFVVDGKAGEVYRLDFERPQNVTQARALEEDFSGWVENMNSGEKTPSQASGLVLNRGFLAPITGTEVETKGASAVQPKAAEAVTPAPAAPKAGSANGSEGGASSSGQANYLDTLKAQWNQATQEERRQFLQWISQ
ncbi:MAG TPA: DUF2057 domain-containing protein [Alcanivorax sp.]|mgnify:FL=1|jgi:uncharacterized protein|nr:DUF2057 domain-containing protein [Alcanivorax sp.]HBS14396.1 DUF2057 domain-containing protein [Alcanivorax sp.]HCD76512.1 DUF2057 domain-containing protein [Alcanivorax sp.]HCJ63357.1 DUF2057 domain-containing protein [Alcanivorax sp.]HCR78666.1 DUF2057 domain-containing protein [Alcanivorax sp.]